MKDDVKKIGFFSHLDKPARQIIPLIRSKDILSILLSYVLIDIEDEDSDSFFLIITPCHKNTVKTRDLL